MNFKNNFVPAGCRGKDETMKKYDAVIRAKEEIAKFIEENNACDLYDHIANTAFIGYVAHKNYAYALATRAVLEVGLFFDEGLGGFAMPATRDVMHYIKNMSRKDRRLKTPMKIWNWDTIEEKYVQIIR